MMDTILNLGLNDQTVARPGKGQQQPALRLGLLPPLHPDVRRRRHGRPKAPRRRSRTFRNRHREPQEASFSRHAAHRRHPARRRRPQGTGLALQDPGQGAHRARNSRPIPGSSSKAPSAPSSAPG